MWVNVDDSRIQVPVEIQGVFQDTVQTHNAVSIGAGATSISSYQDCNGYREVAVTLQNSAATSTTVKIKWSHDGMADNGEETILADGTDQMRAGEVTVKAKYGRIAITNGDASSQTISAWAFFKA